MLITIAKVLTPGGTGASREACDRWSCCETAYFIQYLLFQ